MIYTVTLNPAIDRTLMCNELKWGTVNVADVIGFFPAGKGINVSRCLAALDVPNTATGLIGTRERALFSSFLEKEGIPSLFTEVEGITRTSTTIIDKSKNSETHIKERGFTVSPDERSRFLNSIESTIHNNDIMIVSGSLPHRFSCSDLAETVELCTKKGAGIILDVSGDILRELSGLSPLLIKPNREELSELTGGDSIDAMLEQAYDRGFTAILLTLGKEGVVFYNGKEKLIQPSPQIEYSNSVGAGDAALAGYIAALYQGKGIQERLRWAAAAGAANARERFAGVIDRAWFDQIINDF